MKSTIAVVVTLLVFLAASWVGLVSVARTGAINVAATHDYLPGVEQFLATLQKNSIRRYARQAVENGEIEPPLEVTEVMIGQGSSDYEAMCAMCHGAPGVPRGEIGKGLKPQPPDLSRTAQEMSPAEIYWVLENGIRHTGMPALGSTHSDGDLWAIVSFVERFVDMSPAEYRRLTEQASETVQHPH